MKRIKFLIASLLIVFSLLCAINVKSVNSMAEGQKLMPTNIDVSENFESYDSDTNLEADTKFLDSWKVHATSGTGSMVVTKDPADSTNTVARVSASLYYNITPINIISKNFTISYRINPITTIGTHWVGTLYRKEIRDDVNDPNKGKQLMMLTKFGNTDNKQLISNFVKYKTTSAVETREEDSEPYVEASGVKGQWFEIKNVVQDGYCYNYVNGYLLCVSYCNEIMDAGFLSIHSLSIDYYIDDIVVTTEDKYAIDVISDNAKAGKVETSRSSARENSEIKLSAEANLGYTFQGWYENGELISEEPEYIVETLTTDNRVFEAKWLATQFDLTIDGYDAERGTYTLGGSFEAGSEVLLTAQPFNGFVFAGWYEDDLFISDEIEFLYLTKAENKTVKAKFVPIGSASYTVSLMAKTNEEPFVEGVGELVTTGGTACIVGKNEFYAGQLVALKATTNYEYIFKGWFDKNSNELISNEQVYIFDITADLDVCAIFEDRLFVVTVQNGVDAKQTEYFYKYGTNVNLAYDIATMGYSFSTWYCSNDDAKVSSGVLSFTVTEDITVRAIYAKNKNNLSVSTNAKELGGVSGGYALGAGQVAYGETVTIKPVTNQGFFFKSYELVGVAGVLNEDGSITFVMPDNDVKIVLNFAKDKTVNLGKDLAGFAICLVSLFAGVLLIVCKKKD